MSSDPLHEEFIVCYASAYPDPFAPWPQTLEEAQRFRAESGGVIKRRLVSEWKIIEGCVPADELPL